MKLSARLPSFMELRVLCPSWYGCCENSVLFIYELRTPCSCQLSAGAVLHNLRPASGPWYFALSCIFSQRESESESHSVMSHSLQSHGLDSPWNSHQNTRVGSLSLLQGIFPTKGSNPCLLHCRWICYQLNHRGSPWNSEVYRKIVSEGSLQREQKKKSFLLHFLFIDHFPESQI